MRLFSAARGVSVVLVSSVNSRSVSAKNNADACRSFSQGLNGGHSAGYSDSADFSALAKKMIIKAAAEKKALLSELSERFDPEKISTQFEKPQLLTLSSDCKRQRSYEELKAEIEKIIKESAENAPNTEKNANAGAVSDAVQGGEKPTEQKSMSEWVKEQMEKINDLFSEKEYDKSKDNKLIGIQSKIRRGGTLSIAEQQYLKSKDPDAYERFQKITSARNMFKCSLRSARTKDDVISMRLSNALTALSEYKKAIRKGGSGEDIVALNAAIENDIRDFTRTSCFKALPTVAECNKFDKDMAKARKYEMEKRIEKRRQEAAEKAKKYKKKKKKLIKTPGDGKRTVAQVLNDPTSKKVLASRAKQSYCSCSFSVDLSRKMNAKA